MVISAPAKVVLVNYLQFLTTHLLGSKNLCGKVAKMIMVHFTTFVKVCSKVECAMTLEYDS